MYEPNSFKIGRIPKVVGDSIISHVNFGRRIVTPSLITRSKVIDFKVDVMLVEVLLFLLVVTIYFVITDKVLVFLEVSRVSTFTQKVLEHLGIIEAQMSPFWSRLKKGVRTKQKT